MGPKYHTPLAPLTFPWTPESGVLLESITRSVIVKESASFRPHDAVCMPTRHSPPSIASSSPCTHSSRSQPHPIISPPILRLLPSLSPDRYLSSTRTRVNLSSRHNPYGRTYAGRHNSSARRTAPRRPQLLVARAAHGASLVGLSSGISSPF